MDRYYNIISNIILENIEQIKKRIPSKKLKKNNFNNMEKEYLKNKFNLHIEKDDKNLISVSKKLAYSMDRYKSKKVEQIKNIKKNKYRNQKNKNKEHIKQDIDMGTPLESIFNIFKYDENQQEKIIYQLEGAGVKKSKVNKKDNSVKNSADDYKKIISCIESEIENLFENKDLNSILDLLEKNLFKIPCKINEENLYDISLYDHMKLQIALAGCKYYYSKEEKSEYDNQYILVSADISGIQNFIYTISSKGALKSLRGRSFYLEIICENIIDEILSKIGLCRANLLYSGGGHFYMLLPNTKRATKIIDDAKININQWFIKTYKTKLYMEISYVELNESEYFKNDITSNIIGNMYQDVGKKNSKGKLQRYTVEQLEKLMLESENEQDEKECSICHESFILDVEENICSNCMYISKLGNNLPKIESGEDLILIKETNSKIDLKIPSIDKNKEFSLVIENKSKLLKEPYIRGYSINSKDIQFKNIINIKAGVYSKKIKPKNNELITFEQLAELSKGVKKIGVLRADVDNLGKAFCEGFELKERTDKYKYISLSRNCNLSYSLSKFFKLDINDICKKSKFKIIQKKDEESKLLNDRNVVIVYAGGDDLFIVGAWNDVIELAVDINNKFNSFTSSKMTLSAGIGIFSPKYPIDQMASQVEKLEKIAKSYDKQKNKICLFDFIPENIKNKQFEYRHLYSWEDFEEKVCNEKIKKMYEWFDFDKNEKSKLDIGMSLLYRLLILVRKIKTNEKINLARVAYLIGRLEPQKKDKKKIYLDFKETFYNWMLNKEDLKQLETALTLIIYLNRKDDENE